MQPGFNLFSQQKIGSTDQVANFYKIIERQLCDGVCVRFAQTLKFCASQLPIVTKLVEQEVKNPTILKTCIHTLSIEGNNSMGCIAHEEHVFLYPGITPDSDQGGGGIVTEILYQRGHKGGGVRKELFKESLDLFRCLELCKGVVSFKR